tara:strand:- start:179 stop:790 length:612 start_codon:yes stop_codon:yes gene_type:complete
MKIIELYGYSCSGKSYMANEIKSKENLDINFSIISKKNRFLRFLIKLYYIFLIKYDDLNFILNIHKEFKFLKLKYKLKNFFSFLYLVGFIRNSIKNKKSVIIDHGIFQCLFSCYIFSVENNTNHRNISQNLLKFFFNLPINFDYKIICMQTNIKTIKLRLEKTKRNFQLTFLDQNESKINEAYINLRKISKMISHECIDFKNI